MQRHIALVGLLSAIVIAAVPAGSAEEGGLYYTYHDVTVSVESLLTPGTYTYGIIHWQSQCSQLIDISSRSADTVETVRLRGAASSPHHEIEIMEDEWAIDWGTTECATGNGAREYATEFRVYTAAGAPAWEPETVMIQLKSEWQTDPVSAMAPVMTALTGTIDVSAPEGVVLDPDGHGEVPYTITNGVNAEVEISVYPTLRMLFGPQPDSQTLVLQPGQTVEVIVPVAVTDSGGAIGVLESVIDARASADRSNALPVDPVRVPLEVGGTTSTLAENVEESPSLALPFTLAALAAVGLTSRRRS